MKILKLQICNFNILTHFEKTCILFINISWIIHVWVLPTYLSIKWFRMKMKGVTPENIYTWFGPRSQQDWRSASHLEGNPKQSRETTWHSNLQLFSCWLWLPSSMQKVSRRKGAIDDTCNSAHAYNTITLKCQPSCVKKLKSKRCTFGFCTLKNY